MKKDAFSMEDLSSKDLADIKAKIATKEKEDLAFAFLMMLCDGYYSTDRVHELIDLRSNMIKETEEKLNLLKSFDQDNFKAVNVTPKASAPSVQNPPKTSHAANGRFGYFMGKVPMDKRNRYRKIATELGQEEAIRRIKKTFTSAAHKTTHSAVPKAAKPTTRIVANSRTQGMQRTLQTTRSNSKPARSNSLKRYSVRQLANLVGLSRQRIDQLIRENKLQASKAKVEGIRGFVRTISHADVTKLFGNRVNASPAY